MKRKSKYNAKRTEVDGITFASKREAKRYCELKLMQRAKVISDLQRQVPFQLVMVVKYVADFVYFDRLTGERIVEDVKGYRTAEYRRKRRLMKEQLGITIKET